MDLGKALADKGVQLTKEVQDVIGPIMICFGDIQYDLKVIEKMPEEEKKDEKKEDGKEGEDKKEDETPKPTPVEK